MSKAEILQELPKLTTDERCEIRVKLAELENDGWLDEEDPLSNAERALLKARLAAYEKDPEAGESWDKVAQRIRARLVQ